jgi:hypothetical protein
MKKQHFILMLFALIGLAPGIAIAQSNPVCGLNNNQNAYIPGTSPNGGSSNYDTFVPPAAGGSYVDSLSGCTITRLTDNSSAGTGWVIYYASKTPFNANDEYLLVTNTMNGNWEIVSGPALKGVIPGTLIANYPGISGGSLVWDTTNAMVSYYTPGDTTIHKVTMTGTCTSSSNCTLNDVVLHNFSSGTPTYTSVSFQDEPDMSQDGTVFQFDGQKSSGGSVDIDTYNPSSNTTTVWYTTTCQAGLGGPQPSCSNGNQIHKIQLSAKNEPIITWGASGLGSEQGAIWYHGTPGSPTQTHIQSNTNHLDSGLDINGTEMFVQDRIDSSIGNDPCPSGQWSGSVGGGGATLTYLTDATDSGNSAVCFFNKNWESPHFSYRGGPSQPWVTVSFFDTRTPSPEYFTNDGSFVAPTCTQVNTTTSGTCWYPYEGEIDLVNIATNMDTPGTGPLATVYRMAQARSRTEENFWTQVTASNSHDSNYIAFNSNMAYVAGCSSAVQSAEGCADVYVISASGGPLFANPNDVPPAPPQNLKVTVVQ